MKRFSKRLLSLALVVGSLFLFSCEKENSDYIVIDIGDDDNYLLIENVLSDSRYRKSERDGDTIIFPNNLKANVNEVYTYLDIDQDDFWQKVVKEKETDVEDEDLVLSAIRYTDDSAELIYVCDIKTDKWKVYSYSSILKRDGEYYTINYDVENDGENNSFVDQEFNNPHASFAQVFYDIDDWPLEKFEDWFELNDFTYEFNE